MKRILIIGPIDNAHICRLITNIKYYDKDNSLIFDGFNIDINKHSENSLFTKTYNIKKYFWRFIYSLYFIGTICSYIDIIINFIRIKENYNYYNIHFPSILSAVLFPFLKKNGTKTIISPWGSDVYRIRKKNYYIVKRLYAVADYITVPPIKFRSDIQKKFNVPSSKIINLGFGSEIIDELISSKKTKEEAKIELNIKNKYVITCGYNGSPAQNHIPIIKALISIKALLPSNAIILLPMTYMKNNEYIQTIKDLLNTNNLDYIIYEKYLTNSNTANIRLATDIFIHLQNTDAYSATLQEFLFTDTIVFNGTWTRYPNLERHGIPYILINEISGINSQLSAYFTQQQECKVPIKCKETIKKLSWKNKGKEWFDYFISNEQKF